jgi:titin
MSVTGEILPVVWYKDSKEILDLHKRYEIIKLNRKLILKINEAEIEDSGIYSVTIGQVKTQATLKVNEIPVVFKRPLEDQRAKEGQSVNFECLVNISNKPVIWLINSNQLSIEDFKSGKYTATQDKNKLKLTIDKLDLDKDNNSEVTVLVGNKAKSKAMLQVIEDDIKFVERLADLGTKENETCEFICKLNKIRYKTRPNDDLRIKWFIKGKEITDKDNLHFSIEQIHTTLKLKINSVKPDDASEVKCQITNSIFTSANLSVEEEPLSFVKKLVDFTCDQLKCKAEFDCELNKPNVELKWYKEKIEIKDSLKYKIKHDGKKHFLSINDIEGNDEGEYSATIRGKIDKSSTANLNIKSAPKIFLNAQYKDNITIKRGTPLSIEVDFLAHPEPKVLWLFNDETFKDSVRTSVEIIKNKKVFLTVSKTQRSDSGIYSLMLENDYGREKCDITVNVLDKPSPPLNLEVFDITGEKIFIN